MAGWAEEVSTAMALDDDDDDDDDDEATGVLLIVALASARSFVAATAPGTPKISALKSSFIGSVPPPPKKAMMKVIEANDHVL